ASIAVVRVHLLVELGFRRRRMGARRALARGRRAARAVPAEDRDSYRRGAARAAGRAHGGRRRAHHRETLMEFLALLLFVVIVIVLMSGYPVAFVLGGVSLLFAAACAAFGVFDPVFLQA